MVCRSTLFFLLRACAHACPAVPSLLRCSISSQPPYRLELEECATTIPFFRYRAVQSNCFFQDVAGSTNLSSRSMTWSSLRWALSRDGFRPNASCACAAKTLRSEEHTSELQSQSNLVCRL